MIRALAPGIALIAGLLASGCSPAPNGEPADPTQHIYTSAAAIAPPPRLDTSDSTWIASWAASPGSTNTARDQRYRRIHFRNLTIRQVVRLSAGGDAIRVRLTNETGDRSLEIGAATVAIADSAGRPRQHTRQTLTFSGGGAAIIPPGAPLLSDPLDMPVDDGATLSISLYLPGNHRTCTCHFSGLATAEVSPPGDHTQSEFTPLKTSDQRAFLSGVDVLATGPTRTIVAFGDSVTDGMGSTPNANQRWPDLLADRLNARDDDTTWSVANAGISGNQLLAARGTPSALGRFDRDVLAQPGLTHVIIFIGVNDLSYRLRRGGKDFTPDHMIAGYRQLIARARDHDVSAIGATIAPYQGAQALWSESGEAARLAINNWILNSDEFDATLDFASALADPSNPARIADGLHSGDFLHPSDAGYRALAAMIDLDIFR